MVLGQNRGSVLFRQHTRMVKFREYPRFRFMIALLVLNVKDRMSLNSEEWRNMWGARVQQPCDMVLDQLKCTITEVKSVLESLTPGTEPTEQMAKSIKEWCDENYEQSWHVVIGRNFGTQMVHHSKMFAFFYIGETAVLVAKS